MSTPTPEQDPTPELTPLQKAVSDADIEFELLDNVIASTPSNEAQIKEIAQSCGVTTDEVELEMRKQANEVDADATDQPYRDDGKNALYEYQRVKDVLDSGDVR
jgi:hypothetical protein